MEKTRPLAGLAAIVFAIGFNIPYAILAVTYDYPDILRRPASEALEKFAAGGAGLVLTWHAFAFAALLFVPLAVALALTQKRVREKPALAVGAAVAGALAGLAQAMGLWRWVFVVPGLAQAHRDPQTNDTSKLAAEQTFSLINQYGGVAIGEHMGQLLTALFVVLLCGLQWNEGRRITASIGFVTAAAIAVGTNEGVAIAIGQSGEAFAMATIVGFLGLTIWLLATGIGLLPRQPIAQ
ncbi:DUF4386 family protein [Asticcacaulis sp. AC402]|uniref:DUF4386 family protein n=1 Tax=Asticcacaulis sp. AC402 TaxID=1282361 RepID=UPI0003C3BBAC|nr:DUF4386 family protein [Asticcacaulis sp. AC402]ESQ73993.1 hypothetical protein ABAC402_16640 [Asticcacaulis sp. AC402]